MNIVKWQRPTLTNWPGFGRLSDLRDEIDRLFESPLTELDPHLATPERLDARAGCA